jgi:Na+-transporting NADH:ubiquinone oxidoreductase subunit NqrC
LSIAPTIEDGKVVNQDLIDVYDFFGALRKRRILITAMALACALVMGVTAYMMKPIYRSKATLDPVTSDTNPLTASLMSSSLSDRLGGTIAALTGASSEADRDTDEAMTVLKSRAFTERFLEENHVLPLLFPRLWDARAGHWKDGVKVPTLARGFEAFDKIRLVDVDMNGDFVTLQLDWPDRFQAAEWTNQMIRMLNEELRARAVSAADASLLYLHDEWSKTGDAATREAISRLIESELKTKMLATVTPEFELRFIDKALVADADRPVRPQKLLMVAVGLVFGALLGVMLSLLLYRRELVAAQRL